MMLRENGASLNGEGWRLSYVTLRYVQRKRGILSQCAREKREIKSVLSEINE